jgi:hypothetical protein
MADARNFNKAWVIVAVVLVAVAIWFLINFSAAATR